MERIKWAFVYKHNQFVREWIWIPLWITPIKGFREISQHNPRPSVVRKVIDKLRYGWKRI